MTTEPADAAEPANLVEPATSDSEPKLDADPTSDVDSDPDTDAMGINDDDPLDATLVGQPVESDDDQDGA